MSSNVKSLKKWKMIIKKIDWEIQEERRELLDKLCSLVEDWEGQYPNLRDFFRPEEIDWLLIEAVKSAVETDPDCEIVAFLKFVVKTGYEDEPKVNKHGKPELRRTTALHFATIRYTQDIVEQLFSIYNRFDVNFISQWGRTHFHVACEYGLDRVVAKFLQLDQDPNCISQKSKASLVNPPLHLALEKERMETTKLLLRNGANPNLANSEGFTPLHIICQAGVLAIRVSSFFNMTWTFFKINDKMQQIVLIDAQDKLGRTPLQWAVANLLAHEVDVLFDRGAELSSFVFPTDSHFELTFFEYEHPRKYFIEFTRACRALEVVKRLEKRGYELNRSDALTIMKLFTKFKFFDNSEVLEKSWYDEETFASLAKKKDVGPNLSLNDLTRSRPKEVDKLFTHTDYLDFGIMHYELFTTHKISPAYTQLRIFNYKPYKTWLYDITVGRFCRRWALEPLLELTRYQLPILCCEKIIEKLRSEDVLKVCLAAEIVANEDNQNI
ncbi:unnamed protein product [Trichogramma brassicae]|uniref:Uncharacterized protein n=1 Tax=Trichogramma brassicae TaxID=86971 RepID=A0A6H5J218_9HYME|nr:unnamed protein product [Trichogramma brassicae]